MTVPFLHVREHWTRSRAPDRPMVIYSELPRGDSPVVVRSQVVMYVLEGTERYEIGGRSHVVRAGEFLFVDAGATARVVIPDSGPTRGLCVYLPSGDTASPPAESDPEIDRGFHMPAIPSPLSHMLDLAGRRIARDGPLDSLTSAALMRHTMDGFAALEARLSSETMRVDAARPSTRRDILQRLYRARAWLHDHADGPVALTRVAAMAGMSQFHFARSFRAVFGMPPGRYHAELRIARAWAALHAGHLSVAEAARRFGFAEASSFSRAFHRVAGVSPGVATRLIPPRARF